MAGLSSESAICFEETSGGFGREPARQKNGHRTGAHSQLRLYCLCYDFILAKHALKNQAKLALAKSQLAREARKVSTNLGRALR